MFGALARYVAAAWRFPQGHSLGFLRMGLGIEHRAVRHRDAWRSHIEASQGAERRWLSDIRGKKLGSVAVIGAGRLYDCALHDLCRCFSAIHLIDADPACLPAWRKARTAYPDTAFHFHLVEITGRLTDWSKRFSAAAKKRNWTASLKELEEIGAESAEFTSPLDRFLAEHQPDAVLSLNLMSQLPVMWQDLVERVLRAKFGTAETTAKEEEWIAAYAPSARLLVREHLRSLASSGAPRILLITDVEYLSYPQRWLRGGNLPVNWIEQDDSGRWATTGDAKSEDIREHCSAMDALAGVKVENKKLLSALAPGREAVISPSWLWNICPVPEGKSTSCVVHRVRAIELTKNATAAASA